MPADIMWALVIILDINFNHFIYITVQVSKLSLKKIIITVQVYLQQILSILTRYILSFKPTVSRYCPLFVMLCIVASLTVLKHIYYREVPLQLMWDLHSPPPCGPMSSMAHHLMSNSNTICNSLSSPLADIIHFGKPHNFKTCLVKNASFPSNQGGN